MPACKPAIDLPELHEDPIHLGPPDLLERSFPVGCANYFHLDATEDLELSVRFRQPPPAPRVLLHTDCGDPAWRDLPFHQVDDCTFTLRLPLAGQAPGRYHFRVKYSLAAGPRRGRRAGLRQWFWDRADYSCFLLDPPHLRNLRIYTLVPTVSGSFRDWAAELPRIRDLGFNVVQLLPLTAMDDSASPYAARDHFQVDSAYLNPGDPRPGLAQFEEFVAAVRAAGLALCLDLVFNHVGIHSAAAHSRPDWLIVDPAEPDGIKRAGWSDGSQWHKWQDLALLYYDNPHGPTRDELWAYMCKYACFWSRYAHQTGGMIRLDNLHSGHPEFMRYVLGELRRAYPELIIQAELFTDHPTINEMVLRYGLSLLLATPWEHHFTPPLRQYIQYVHGLAKRWRFHFPITSHDSGTPVQEFGSVQATIPRYVIAALLGAGSTGMVQGVEFGVPERLQFIGRHPRYRPSGDTDFSARIRAINRIMDEHPVFHRGGNLRFVDDGHEAILAAWRGEPQPGQRSFLILANLDIYHEQQLVIDLAGNGLAAGTHAFRDLLAGDLLRPEAGRLACRLPPCGVLVLQREP